jgi:SAM-dependent methyltransferase
VERKRAGQWVTPWWVVAAAMREACRDLPERPVIADLGCGDGRWLIAAARERPGARLVGVDLDPRAVEAAAETCRRAGVRAELIVGDALADPPPIRDADLVVGNPPFVRPQNLPRPVREDLWRRFSTATDKADLYACFVERALEVARRLVLVLPEYWLHLASFHALRERVLAAGVDGLFELPRGTFAEVPVPTVLLFAGSGDGWRAGRLESDGRLSVDGSVFVGAEAWSLRGPLPELPGRPLGEVASIHMGVVCGDYPRYVHRGRRYPEDRPTCRGRDVLRWTIRPGDEYVRYLPREMLQRKPYVAPKHAGLFDVPEKVVLAGTTGTEIRAAVDTERRFPLDSCYVLHSRHPELDSWALLGFLLSRPVQDWYGARHRAPRVKAVELARIPVPHAGWAAVAEAARARDDAALDAAVVAAYAQ